MAGLIESWARTLGLDPAERVRWTAAARLHDALRDADPKELREELSGPEWTWPDPLLHGPAVAVRLRGEGVDDEALLLAIAYHTVGHPDFDTMGRALYAADFLEPGRRVQEERRAALRERMPHELDTVVLHVVRARLEHALEARRPIFSETAAFWSQLLEVPGASDAG